MALNKNSLINTRMNKKIFFIGIIILFSFIESCEKENKNSIKWNTFTIKDGLTADFVLSMAIDSLDNKWFGTAQGGVSKFDGKTWTTYTVEDGLVNHYVQTIAIDKNGNLWFGTAGGISKFDGTIWTNYSKENGLIDNYVF